MAGYGFAYTFVFRNIDERVNLVNILSYFK